MHGSPYRHLARSAVPHGATSIGHASLVSEVARVESVPWRPVHEAPGLELAGYMPAVDAQWWGGITVGCRQQSVKSDADAR
eukprot:COSAG01_NODE_1401_length_10450_cov_100.148198_4_plen_81_part_00